ncbi:hypothetical protein FJZ31_36625 [Candidatus Poribacteria bacterium]|nr:hypothetical protein [Candidatus Poribacteria bacterium]
MIKIGYVDDEVDESVTGAKHYQDQLSSEEIECELISPPKWEQFDNLVNEKYDLFLIDYELDKVQSDDKRVDYRGTTLTAEIRARLPDYPIVLITRESILDHLNRQTRRQLSERRQVCDELILKSDLDNKPDDTQQLLISLANGFSNLRNAADNTWKSLVKLLGADEEETDFLREAAPPLPEGKWIVTEAADWVRNVVLKFPSILYDPIHAATRLGISLNSFWNNKVQGTIEPAKYTGIFAPSEGRWWKGRLFRVAKELAMEKDINGPINQAFAKAFHEEYSIELSPAICVWDKTPIADWVCYILRKPVKLRNSLRYYPDSRPSIMDPARVSFRAIRESNAFEEELLDAEGIKLLEKIETLSEPSKS